LKYQPGEKFAYSNLNYLPPGEIIEKVSGVSYGTYIHLNITAKLNRDDLPLKFLIADDANYARGYQNVVHLSMQFLASSRTGKNL